MLSGSGMHASLIPVTETWTMLRAERRSKVFGSICTRLMKSSAQCIAWGTPDRDRSTSSNRFLASKIDDDCSSREMRTRRAASSPVASARCRGSATTGRATNAHRAAIPTSTRGSSPLSPTTDGISGTSRYLPASDV